MPAARSILKSPAFMIVAIGLAVAGCETKKTLPDNANGLGLNNGATPGSQQDFTVNVGDRIFFETDSSSLTQTARVTLDKQSQWLVRYTNYPITIEGHADERGTREFNLALGARRAEAVRAFLVSQGVAAGRLTTISYGKERPAAPCSAETCWSQNRRGVTVLAGAPTS